ncbi:hypothetical protein Tco_0213572 [Tanacetum coccineum]
MHSLPPAIVPAITVQFWEINGHTNEKTGVYSCQVDEQWFDLSVDLLRKALALLCKPNSPIWFPPIVDTCLTGKTSGSDKPRHPVLQMLWGIVTQTNVDHAELIWEEFTQGIQTFFSHKASHKASLKNPKKKVTPLLIPYGRFSKVIIYYLASNNNIHRRPDSAVHHTGDDYILGNLKFIPKGESVEVFGMAIPDPLITEAIQQSSYYPKYLEMVAENTKKTPQESASVQSATKRATPKKPTTTTPVKQTKPAPPPTKKPSKPQQESIPHEEGNDPDLELAKKLSLETPQEKGEGEGRAPVGGVTIRDPVSETTSKLHEVVGKGKAVVTEEQVAHSLINLSKKKRTTDQFILVRRDQTPPDSTTGPSSQPDDDTSEKVIHESSSTSDSERTESETEAAAPKGDKDQDEVDTSTVTSGVSIPISDPEQVHETLAGPDPEPMKEDQTGSDSGKLHVSLAGPNPEHMDDEFLTTAYPKGTKLDDALLKVLERHTADLIEKYSVLPGPEFVKNQESEKSPKEIIRAKKEQDEEYTNFKQTHQVTDKVDLEEFDLKSLEVKNHKRKHDSDDDEDDDDDEGPSAGSNQGRSTKKRRSDSAASGSAKPPPKNDDQSSKKPRESDAICYSKHIRSYQQDEGMTSDMEDTDNAHIPKVSTTTWFKPIPESERPATPEPEWTIPPNDFPEPEHNWANAYATTRTGKKKLCKADLKGPAFNLVKAFHKNSVFLQYQMDECHKLLTNKVDLSNPEGHQILRNIYETTAL